MAKRSLSPEVIAQAVALREAGYTVLSISQRLGVGLRTLERHFSRHRVTKGAVTDELLEQARADVLSHITSNETVKAEIATLIVDNIAHAKHLRNILVEASEHMKATSLQEVVLVARAAAAYATAIKTTSDAIRSTLPIERTHAELEEELPELIVTELTAEQIEAIKNEKRVLE